MIWSQRRNNTNRRPRQQQLDLGDLKTNHEITKEMPYIDNYTDDRGTADGQLL